MLWFKHAHDFRNSPAMKQIQRKLGDEGFAAAVRLIEVLTYRCGSGTRFNPVITLCPPTTELWLAQEILTAPVDAEDEGTDYSPADHINEFLNEFVLAGLIVCKHIDGQKPVQTTEGWEHRPCKWLTIQLVEFEEFMDVWTARKVKDAKNDAA